MNKKLFLCLLALASIEFKELKAPTGRHAAKETRPTSADRVATVPVAHNPNLPKSILK
jgi:hypothetical protein